MVGRRLDYSASPDPGRGWGYCVHPLIRATQPRGLTLDRPLRKPDQRAGRREREKDAKAAWPMYLWLFNCSRYLLERQVLAPRLSAALSRLISCVCPIPVSRHRSCPLLRDVLTNGVGNSKT